jgi:hypothetical protein
MVSLKGCVKARVRRSARLVDWLDLPTARLPANEGVRMTRMSEAERDPTNGPERTFDLHLRSHALRGAITDEMHPDVAKVSDESELCVGTAFRQ